MTEALSRHTDASSCVKEIRKLSAKLDRDLKIWVAHKYGLISAGKPESGMMPQWRIPPERWLPGDVEFAAGWDNWLRKSQERTDCEALNEELTIWEKGAVLQGATLTSVEVAGAEAVKENGWPWKKIAIGGAVAFGAYWFFFRNVHKPAISPIVEEPKFDEGTDYEIIKSHRL